MADTWGYRVPFLLTGTLLFLAGLTVWRFVQEDFSPPSRDVSDPESSFWYGLKLVAGHRRLLSLFGIRLLVRTSARLLGPILALFVQSMVPATTRIASLTGLITGATGAASAIGALTLGRASDRIGYRRVLLACALATAVLYVPQFFVTAPWQLLILQAAVGLVMSGVLASISALLAHLSPEGHEGAVFGVDASVVSAANAVGPMLGASVAATYGLRAPFLLTAGGFTLVTALTWTLVPPKERRRRPTASG
jgi:DHA1 family multidrug resistance protein-like MFS transporter